MRILDEQVEYFTPTVEQLKEWFDEFNERFFEGDLERIPLILTLLDEGVMGTFHYSNRKYDTTTLRYTDPLDINRCYICVAKNLFDSELEWRNTLLHEMVHYSVYKYADSLVDDPHGEEFKREARRINRMSEFTVTATFEHDIFTPGKRKRQDFQESQNRQLILGVLHPEEEQQYNRFSGDGFYATFLTEERHISMIVENWRHMTAQIDWYQIDACTKRLLLFDITTWAWDEITEGPTRECAPTAPRPAGSCWRSPARGPVRPPRQGRRTQRGPLACARAKGTSWRRRRSRRSRRTSIRRGGCP